MVKASREFQIFAKPADSACNLQCHYCYYLGKDALFGKGGALRMADNVLEAYIAQRIAASPSPVTRFSWRKCYHDGQPIPLRKGERRGSVRPPA